MYCSKCGKPVRDDDAYCRRCGAKLEPIDDLDDDFSQDSSGNAEDKKEEPQEPAIPKIKIDSSEFVWNIHEFSSPDKEKKKTEDVVVDWEHLRVYDIVEEQERQRRERLAEEMKQEEPEKAPTYETEDEPVQEAEAVPQKEEVEDSPQKEETAVAPQKEEIEAVAQKKEKDLTQEKATFLESLFHINYDEEKECKDVTIEDIEEETKTETEGESIDARRDTARIDKFYTFNKKNEEFQRLLDSEYERVNKTRTEEERASILDIAAAGTAATVAIATEAKAIEEAETEAEQNPDVTGNAEETHTEKAESVLQEESEADSGVTEAKEEKWENLGVFNPESHLKEAETQRNAFSDGIMDNETIIKKFDTRELEKDVLELMVAREAKERGLANKNDAEKREHIETSEDTGVREERATGMQEDIPEDPAAQERLRLLNELYGELPAVVKAETVVPTVEEVKKTEAEELQATEEIKTETEELQAEEDVKKETEKEAALQSEALAAEAKIVAEEIEEEAVSPKAAIAAVADEVTSTAKEEHVEPKMAVQTVQEDYIDDSDEEEVPAKIKIVRVAIIIAVILLVIELVIIGVKYFAPDSSFAKAIDSGMERIVHSVFKGDSGEAGAAETGDATGEIQGDVSSAGLPTEAEAEEEVNAEAFVLESQLINKNIKEITVDSSLTFNPATKYDMAGVAEAQPITTEVWYNDEEGKPVYAGQEVINTLVDFNSKWIDYVNTKDEAVFELLDKNGDAYKNCRGFKKAGQQTKEFIKLKVGEIRASSTGYFIWDEEHIKTTEKGTTKDNTYRWVYYMEPEGNELKIVDYFRF